MIKDHENQSSGTFHILLCSPFSWYLHQRKQIYHECRYKKVGTFHWFIGAFHNVMCGYYGDCLVKVIYVYNLEIYHSYLCIKSLLNWRFETRFYSQPSILVLEVGIRHILFFPMKQRYYLWSLLKSCAHTLLLYRKRWECPGSLLMLSQTHIYDKS